MISIIVPVYNVEKYFEKCIDSLVGQTYKDLDIILIDDGSTDKSPQICDRYALSDNRVRVLHQTNKGLSKARNVGLSMANGDYITFIDSDDYIELDTMETVMEAIERFGSDLVFFREKSVDETGKTTLIKGPEPTGLILEKDRDFAENRIMGELINGVCDKVYRADIIKDLTFETGRIYGEDFMFNLMALSKVEKVAYIDQIKYSYVSNSGSITHKSFSPNSFDQIYFKDRVCEYVKKEFPKYAHICEKYAYLARLRLLRPIYFEHLQNKYKSEILSIRQYLKDNYKRIKKMLSFREIAEYQLYFKAIPLYYIFLKIVYTYRK